MRSLIYATLSNPARLGIRYVSLLYLTWTMITVETCDSKALRSSDNRMNSWQVQSSDKMIDNNWSLKPPLLCICYLTQMSIIVLPLLSTSYVDTWLTVIKQSIKHQSQATENDQWLEKCNHVFDIASADSVSRRRSCKLSVLCLAMKVYGRNEDDCSVFWKKIHHWK